MVFEFDWQTWGAEYALNQLLFATDLGYFLLYAVEFPPAPPPPYPPHLFEPS